MLSPPLYCGNMIFLLKIGLSGGLNGTAWQGYIAKGIPVSRRGLFFVLCNLAGGVGSSGGCGVAIGLCTPWHRSRRMPRQIGD